MTVLGEFVSTMEAVHKDQGSVQSEAPYAARLKAVEEHKEGEERDERDSLMSRGETAGLRQARHGVQIDCDAENARLQWNEGHLVLV